MKKKIGKIFLWLFFIAVAIVLIVSGLVWHFVMRPNTNNESPYLFYVYQEDDFDDVVDRLDNEKMLKNSSSLVLFGDVSNRKEVRKVVPGCYTLRPGMRNLDIARMVFLGWQTPVRLTFNSLRLPENFAATVSRQLMMDSLEVMRFVQDSAKMASLGMTYENMFTMIVPNTYEVWWNVSVDELMTRLVKERDDFWNKNDRLQKAEKLGLTPAEVATLASIVDEESHYGPELSTIAGLYLNRLRKGMLLQSDPTVKYALRDFAKTRILNEDLKADSPYNTYKYKGLPPGPIRLPNAGTIDAVLNAESHKYIYMCADPSFNGTHRFAVTLSEHTRNAAAYHAALSKLNKK